MDMKSGWLVVGIAVATVGCGDDGIDIAPEPVDECFVEQDEPVQDFAATPEGFSFAPSAFIDAAEGTFEGAAVETFNGDTVVGTKTELEVTVTSVRALVESEGSPPSSPQESFGAPRDCYGAHYVASFDLALTTPDGELDELVSIEATIIDEQGWHATGASEVGGTLRPSEHPDEDWDTLSIQYDLSFQENGAWSVRLSWYGSSEEIELFSDEIGESTLSAASEPE